MVRSIEQILGAQPLNQKVVAATPMDGAFTKKVDTTPYQTHSWKKPYPGDPMIYAPDDVPGAAIPGVDGDH